jgi:uncharacterized protein involved in exopolysaccharide biosynthesis
MAFSRKQKAGNGRPTDEWSGAGRSLAPAMREILTLLFRERRLLLTSALAIIICGAAVAYLTPVTYTATNKLLVLSGQEYVQRPDASGSMPLMAMDQNQLVHTEIEIFNSAMLMERVIEALGLENVYPDIARIGAPSGWAARLMGGVRRLVTLPGGPAPDTGPALEAAGAIAESQREVDRLRVQRMAMELAIFVFRQNLKLVPIKDANVIEISFTHPDPVMAAKICNQLREDGLSYRRQLLSRTKPQQFAEQRDTFKSRLNEIEGQIDGFKRANHISSFAEEKTLLLHQRSEMATARRASEARLAELTAQLASLRADLARMPEQIDLYNENTTQDSTETARASLLSLEMRRSELASRFTEDSRFIKDLQKQISEAKRLVNAAPRRVSMVRRIGRNPLWDEVKARILSAQSEQEALTHRLEAVKVQEQQLTARMASFDQLEHQYNDFVRERELFDQNFKTYAQNAEMAKIQAEQEQQKTANIRVIEEARPPTRSNNPQSLIVLASIMLGVIGGLALVFVIDFFRDTLLTPQAAERALRLPVLVVVDDKPRPPRANPGSNLGPNPGRYIQAA